MNVVFLVDGSVCNLDSELQLNLVCIFSLFNFIGDPAELDLSAYEVHHIGGALKRYLRELPNPVIAVEFYEQLIEAASK